MSENGTAAYAAETDLPPLVVRAVALARRLAFPCSCRPEHGRLLEVLARGRSGGAIGETGTGCGVGLAWLVTGAGPSTSVVSVEADAERAAAVTELFADQPQVRIVHDDWTAIAEHGPFDLLVLDGGGGGKRGEEPVDPGAVLRVGGALVVDDLTPLNRWPPTYAGRPDTARLHWFAHPDVAATELRLDDDLASLVGVRLR